MDFRKDANVIISGAIKAVLPDEAVKKALAGKSFSGSVYLVAIGKAAWQMANAAEDILGKAITAGIVITKYEHSKGDIPGVRIIEAGHPVPDDNSFKATDAVLEMTTGLSKNDTVLFLLSGGGSALFEKPLINGSELRDIT